MFRRVTIGFERCLISELHNAAQRIPNGLECQGTVRWTNEISAGLLLVDVLSAGDLGAVSGLGEKSV